MSYTKLMRHMNLIVILFMLSLHSKVVKYNIIMNQRKGVNLEMQNLKGNDLPTVRSQVELKEKKFNITTVEFYVALTLALSMMIYHFTSTAIKIRELYGKFGLYGVSISITMDVLQVGLDTHLTVPMVNGHNSERICSYSQ